MPAQFYDTFGPIFPFPFLLIYVQFVFAALIIFSLTPYPEQLRQRALWFRGFLVHLLTINTLTTLSTTLSTPTPLQPVVITVKDRILYEAIKARYYDDAQVTVKYEGAAW